MEAASIPEAPGVAPRRPVVKVLSDNVLWILLGAGLIVYFVSDPKQTLDDVKTGLSNGAIWALIALGYTLVYGIVELINFAHGEVFMLGSFISASFFTTIGLHEGSSAVVLFFGILLTLLIAMLGSGTINTLIEKVGYQPLRNAPKLAPLITAVRFSFILQ